MRQSSTARSATIVAIALTISTLLGFAREIVLATYFGTSRQADALLVALLIPTFFLNLLTATTLAAAVVPVFTSAIAPLETEDQRRIIGSAFTVVPLVLVPLCVLMILAAPILARLFAPGFSSTDMRLTATLMQIMLPSVIFLGLSNLVTGVLHAFKRFGAASTVGAVWNLAVVVTTIALGPRIGVVAPAVGVLVGSVLQLVVMLPSLKQTGFFGAVGFRFRDPTLMRIWALFLPVFGGALIAQILKIFDKVIASFLPTGSIAALSYADKIAGGPAGIFGLAISTVLFPLLAEKVSQKSGDLGRTLSSGLSSVAILTLPWTAIVIALRVPIVTLLLQHGAFDARATALVAFPLAIYSLAGFAEGVGLLLNNTFYSHHDSKTPVAIDIGSKVLRVVVTLAFVRWIGYGSVALGTVVGANFAVVLLLARLRPLVTTLDVGAIGSSLTRIATASALGGVASWLVFGAIKGALGPPTTALQAVALLAGSLAAIIVFGAVARILRVEEVSQLLERIVGFIRTRFAH